MTVYIYVRVKNGIWNMKWKWGTGRYGDNEECGLNSNGPTPRSPQCEVEGILAFGCTPLILSFSPQTIACFFTAKSVNAWPALAERLHTSMNLDTPFCLKMDFNISYKQGRQLRQVARNKIPSKFISIQF